MLKSSLTSVPLVKVVVLVVASVMVSRRRAFELASRSEMGQRISNTTGG